MLITKRDNMNNNMKDIKELNQRLRNIDVHIEFLNKLKKRSIAEYVDLNKEYSVGDCICITTTHNRNYKAYVSEVYLNEYKHIVYVFNAPNAVGEMSVRPVTFRSKFEQIESIRKVK